MNPIKSMLAVIPLIAIVMTVVVAISAVIGSIAFSLYLLIMVIGPWILNALIAAAAPHLLALLVVILPALIVAAPLFAFLCSILASLYGAFFYPLQRVDTRTEYRRNGIDHMLIYFEKRHRGFDFLQPFFFIYLVGAATAGIGAGIYLAVMIVPAFIVALTAAGTAPLLAVSAGVVIGGAFIALTILFLMAPIWIWWRIIALPGFKDIQENPLQALPLLAMFAGLTLGGYLVSLVYPLLLAALVPIGIPHATIIFAAIIICSELILATSFCSFAAASGIPYLFNHFRFPAIPRDKLNSFGKKISSVLNWQPKNIPSSKETDPIKQAIANYHKTKSVWWKLLSFITFGFYGSHPDIRKIEIFLKKNPALGETEKSALKTLIGQRVNHTKGTDQFYQKSPLDPVNQAYLYIAYALAGQENEYFLSITACQILMPSLKAESLNSIDQKSGKLKNCLKPENFDPDDWRPGEFLIAERDDGIYAWPIAEIASNFQDNRFAFQKRVAIQGKPNPLDFITPFEERLIRFYSSAESQELLKEAEEKARPFDPHRLPKDALQQIQGLIEAFRTKTPTELNRLKKAEQAVGHNSQEQGIDKEFFSKFCNHYLPSLPKDQRTALLRQKIENNAEIRRLHFAELIFHEVNNTFLLHNDEKSEQPLKRFFETTKKHRKYAEYKDFVHAIILQYSLNHRMREGESKRETESPLTKFIQNHSEYKQLEKGINDYLSKPHSTETIYEYIDGLLTRIDKNNLFNEIINIDTNELRGLLLKLSIEPEFRCNEMVTKDLRAIESRLKLDQKQGIDHHIPSPTAKERLQATLGKQKKSWEQLLQKALLIAFHNEGGMIIYAHIQKHATAQGLSFRELRDDLSFYKLCNPLCWLEFLLIFITTGIPVLINQIFFIITLPFTYWAWLLNQWSRGWFSPTSYIVAIGQIPLDILWFIMKHIMAVVIFLLRTLTSPIQTVWIPLYTFYQKQPVKFFSLFLLSVILVAFLMTGFGLGTIFPSILWLSHAILGAAGILSAGSPALTAIIGLLLISLLLYKTLIILDALLIPFIKMVTLSFCRGLYFISEWRFENVNFVTPTFDTRYHISLTMPALTSTFNLISKQSTVQASKRPETPTTSHTGEEKERKRPQNLIVPQHNVEDKEVKGHRYNDFDDDSGFDPVSSHSLTSSHYRGLDLAPRELAYLNDDAFIQVLENNPHLFD